MTENQLRNKVVEQAKKWYGCKESDGSHKKIIDTYNEISPLPRGYKVQYTDEWCATFVSAVGAVCELSDIIPAECSCNQMIALHKELGTWVEDDKYQPEIGDILMYDWDDSGTGDNKGVADHVGIVTNVEGNTITVIEGNKGSGYVGYRDVTVNGKYIRGYCVPNYAKKSISDTEEKPVNPAGIKVGSSVKIKAGAVYTNGVKVPDSVIGKTYTVQQINGAKALLREIVSWVETKYLTVVSEDVEEPEDNPDDSKKYGTCTGNGVCIRKEAHTAAQTLGTANKGDKLELLDDDGWGWSKVKFNGVTGWMYNEYVSGSGRSNPKTVYCNGTAVNLRKSPSTSAKVVRQLNKGDKVTLVSINPDGWLDVDGGYLYYDKSYLEIK